jgi:hypothetical protein
MSTPTVKTGLHILPRMINPPLVEGSRLLLPGHDLDGRIAVTIECQPQLVMALSIDSARQLAADLNEIATRLQAAYN